MDRMTLLLLQGIWIIVEERETKPVDEVRVALAQFILLSLVILRQLIIQWLLLFSLYRIQQVSHLMKLEEVVIFSRLQLVRILVLQVARVEALLLRLKFHTLTIILYLLHTKE